MSETIREIARKAIRSLDHGPENSSLDMKADAVAVAVLKEVSRHAIETTASGGMKLGIIFLPVVDSMLSALAGSSPAPSLAIDDIELCPSCFDRNLTLHKARVLAMTGLSYGAGSDVERKESALRDIYALCDPPASPALAPETPQDEPCPHCGVTGGHTQYCTRERATLAVGHYVHTAPSSPAPDWTPRQRIIDAGQGWCQFTHQHDNSRAAVAAAREALLIAKEQIDDGLDAGVFKEYATGYADANKDIRGVIDDLLTALSRDAE